MSIPGEGDANPVPYIEVRDEYDELTLLASEAMRNEPWRDLPCPKNITTPMVLQWIQGPIRRFIVRLLETPVRDYVFPELGFPQPFFVEVEWPPREPEPGEVVVYHIGRHANYREPQRGDFRNVLCAVAMLTVWKDDPKYAGWQLPDMQYNLSCRLRYEIEYRLPDVLDGLRDALSWFVGGTEYRFKIVPLLRKAGPRKEAVERFMAEMTRRGLEETAAAGRPEALEPKAAKVGQECQAQTDWHDVQDRLLGLYERGERYTCQGELAERMGCSTATVNKAINDGSPNGKMLRAWMDAAESRKPAPKVRSLHPMDVDKTPDRKETDPAEHIPDDEVDRMMAVLVQQATPEDRAKLNAMNQEGRREMARLWLEQRKDPESTPVDLNDTDRKHKPIKLLGRKP